MWCIDRCVGAQLVARLLFCAWKKCDGSQTRGTGGVCALLAGVVVQGTGVLYVFRHDLSPVYPLFTITTSAFGVLLCGSSCCSPVQARQNRCKIVIQGARHVAQMKEVRARAESSGSLLRQRFPPPS